MATTAKAASRNNLPFWTGFDNVVPIAVELAGDDVDRRKFFGRDLDALVVFSFVQFGMHFEPRISPCGANECDDDLIAFQRFASPRTCDVAEQTMLDLVPFTRARWKVTHFDLNAKEIRESLQFVFPKTTASPIATAAVGRDQ